MRAIPVFIALWLLVAVAIGWKGALVVSLGSGAFALVAVPVAMVLDGVIERWLR